MKKEKRNAIADFWDEAVKEWLNTTDEAWLNRLQSNDRIDDLAQWFRSYNGVGEGAVNRSHGLEAFAGDLRGMHHEPRLIALGLNPGVAYDKILSRTGSWTKEIAKLGYSRCFTRSPPTDPVVWRSLHGTTSRYWDRLIKFAQRWLSDPNANVHDILNFELYPWHSKSLNAGIETPGFLVERYIFEPIAEFNVPEVFAFGAPWFNVAWNLMQSRSVKEIASPRKVLGASDSSHWTMGLYELPSKQILVVSSQSGSAGPPGPLRLEAFRSVVESVRS